MNGNPQTITGSNEILILDIETILTAGLDINSVINAASSGIFLRTNGGSFYEVMKKETFLKNLEASTDLFTE